ncbi:hypothetical protein DFH07DRAFT_1000843 [Mycena maculata]|uniref:Uncharacterized protein n=1 Tax=Mycena maculata TaxID=230809 RepID=A0AAD7MQK7_9AGAR|nr:hypothetical protein DFH07DRAFT_1000843 [Mycena maculata]
MVNGTHRAWAISFSTPRSIGSPKVGGGGRCEGSEKGRKWRGERGEDAGTHEGIPHYSTQIHAFPLPERILSAARVGGTEGDASTGKGGVAKRRRRPWRVNRGCGRRYQREADGIDVRDTETGGRGSYLSSRVLMLRIIVSSEVQNYLMQRPTPKYAFAWVCEPSTFFKNLGRGVRIVNIVNYRNFSDVVSDNWRTSPIPDFGLALDGNFYLIAIFNRPDANHLARVRDLVEDPLIKSARVAMGVDRDESVEKTLQWVRWPLNWFHAEVRQRETESDGSDSEGSESEDDSEVEDNA